MARINLLKNAQLLARAVNFAVLCFAALQLDLEPRNWPLLEDDKHIFAEQCALYCLSAALPALLCYVGATTALVRRIFTDYRQGRKTSARAQLITKTPGWKVHVLLIDRAAMPANIGDLAKQAFGALLPDLLLFCHATTHVDRLIELAVFSLEALALSQLIGLPHIVNVNKGMEHFTYDLDIPEDVDESKFPSPASYDTSVVDDNEKYQFHRPISMHASSRVSSRRVAFVGTWSKFDTAEVSWETNIFWSALLMAGFPTLNSSVLIHGVLILDLCMHAPIQNVNNRPPLCHFERDFREHGVSALSEQKENIEVVFVFSADACVLLPALLDKYGLSELKDKLVFLPMPNLPFMQDRPVQLANHRLLFNIFDREIERVFFLRRAPDVLDHILRGMWSDHKPVLGNAEFNAEVAWGFLGTKQTWAQAKGLLAEYLRRWVSLAKMFLVTEQGRDAHNSAVRSLASQREATPAQQESLRNRLDSAHKIFNTMDHASPAMQRGHAARTASTATVRAAVDAFAQRGAASKEAALHHLNAINVRARQELTAGDLAATATLTKTQWHESQLAGMREHSMAQFAVARVKRQRLENDRDYERQEAWRVEDDADISDEGEDW